MFCRWCDTWNFGLNASVAQLVTWNGVATLLVAPWVLVRVPTICILLQLVGLNVNSSRSTLTFTCCICSGMPSRIVGSGSLTICSAAVCGIHVDRSPHNHYPQVERACLRGVHDR